MGIRWSGEVQFGFSHTHFILQSLLVGVALAELLV